MIKSWLSIMSKIKKHRFSNTEKGQSLIEFSAMVILLIIVVAGIVDLGRMFVVYINLRDAVEDGAIYASVSPTDCADIQQRVLDNVNNSLAVSVEVTIGGVDCTTASATPATYAVLGNEVRVTATYNDFTIATPFIGTILGAQTFDLRSTITSTILRPLGTGG